MSRPPGLRLGSVVKIAWPLGHPQQHDLHVVVRDSGPQVILAPLGGGQLRRVSPGYLIVIDGSRLVLTGDEPPPTKMQMQRARRAAARE